MAKKPSEEKKGKKNKLKLVNFYIKPEEYKVLTDWCDKNNLSYASIIRAIFNQAIQNLEGYKAKGEAWQ